MDLDEKAGGITDFEPEDCALEEQWTEGNSSDALISIAELQQPSNRGILRTIAWVLVLVFSIAQVSWAKGANMYPLLYGNLSAQRTEINEVTQAQIEQLQAFLEQHPDLLKMYQKYYQRKQDESLFSVIRGFFEQISNFLMPAAHA